MFYSLKIQFSDYKIKSNFWEKIPQINAIIAVRSILGKNKNLLYELKEVFIMSFFDVKIESLDTCKDILNYWNLIISQKNFKFHRFVNYSDFYPGIYGAMADEELKFDERFAFGQENHFISDSMNISGIQKKLPDNHEILLYLIKLFMLHNNMIIYKKKLFTKIKKSKISWQFYCNLDNLKNKMHLIIFFLLKIYPGDLENSFFIKCDDSDHIFLKTESQKYISGVILEKSKYLTCYLGKTSEMVYFKKLKLYQK